MVFVVQAGRGADGRDKRPDTEPGNIDQIFIEIEFRIRHIQVEQIGISAGRTGA